MKIGKRTSPIRSLCANRIFVGAIAALSVVVLASFAIVSPANAKTEKFACISDTHIGLNKQNAADTVSIFAYAKKQKNLAAVVNAGDVTNLGGKAEYDKYKNLYKKSKLKVPMIQTIGNHDNAAGGNKKWLKKGGYSKYNKLTGVNYFKKILNGGKITTVHHFSNVDVITLGQGFRQTSEGIFPNSMITWLDQQLKAAHRAGKFAMVVCHYPPEKTFHSSKYDDPRMPRVIGICQSYPNVIYVCGHNHDYPKNYAFNSKYKLKHASASTYAREGIDSAKASYPLTLICLESVSRIKGTFGKSLTKGQCAFADFVTFADNGSVSVVKRNMTKKKNVSKNSFKKKTGSITVAAKSKAKVSSSSKVSYKVVFSDKKSYGQVKNGGTFTLSVGQTKTFNQIPAGVLVAVTPVSADNELKLVAAQQKEVTTSTTNITFTHPYNEPTSDKPKDNPTFKISYKGLKTGSSTMSPTSFKSSDLPLKLGAASNPTGYTFKCWNSRSDLKGSAVPQIAIGTIQDVTLYAQYTPNNYSIRFDGNGATSGTMSPQTATYDSKTNLRANTYKKAGSTFKGWSRSRNGAVEFLNGTEVINLSTGSDVTLYAIWELAPDAAIDPISLKSGYWAAYDKDGNKLVSPFKCSTLTPIAQIKPANKELADMPGSALSSTEYRIMYLYNSDRTFGTGLVSSTGVGVKDAFVVQFYIR